MKAASVPPGALGVRQPDAEPSPTVPRAALGERSPTAPVVHALPLNAFTVVREEGRPPRLEPVLGGESAMRQARAVLRASLKTGQRLLEQLTQAEAKRATWIAIESEMDELFKQALSASVPPRPGETDDAYDARLDAVFANLRLRLDEPPVRDVGTTAPAPAPARPTVVGQTDPTSSPRSAPIVVLRREARRLRREFYALHRRSPTVAEFEQLVREAHGAAR